MRVSTILFVILLICTVWTCLYVVFSEMWLLQAYATRVEIPSSWYHEFYMIRDSRVLFLMGTLLLGVYLVYQRKYALPSEPHQR